MESVGEVQTLADSLIGGGDTRLLLGIDGLSTYGCTPFPRNTIPFGSCTASTVSLRAWKAARAAAARLDDLRRQQRAPDVAEMVCAEIRDELAVHLGLEHVPGAEVLLTPSGTDAELVALFVAGAATDRRLLNIVVGPNEVGSGTTLAAGALHFDEVVPSGARRAVGSAVDEDLAARVDVEVVRLRTPVGVMRPPEEIDEEVRRIVARGIDAGYRVIVHVVAHSKTGVHAPTLGTVNELAVEHGDRVIGLIDAAQGRISRRGLRDYLRRGYMLLLTGSKFYGGPPFSGALLVPPRLSGDDVRAVAFPDGFADYFTAAEVPPSWGAARRSLPDRANWGLMLRWLAALEEIRAYYRTAPELRLAILRHFERSVPGLLGETACVRLLPVYPPLLAEQAERVLESKTTVFSMSVQVPGEDRPLAKGELRRWVRLLNTDLSGHPALADVEPSDAVRQPFQVGQPVELGSGEQSVAVFRLALGASLITSLAEEPSYGATFEERLDWLDRQLSLLAEKMTILAERWPAFNPMERA